MSRLERLDAGKREFRDRRTGRRVVQLTGWKAASVGCYAALCPFGLDESCVVFQSLRTGRWEIYKVHIESGEAQQLTEREGVGSLSLNVAPGGREVYYTEQKRIWAVDLQSGAERLAVDYSSLAKTSGGFYVTFSDEGRKTVVCYTTADGMTGIAVAAADGSMLEPVFERLEDIQHLRHNPGDEHTASFSVGPDRQNWPHFPPEMRARSWQLDLRTGKAFPLIVMPPGSRATHESWAPDGSRIFCHRKTVPGWVPASIASVPKGGGPFKEHFIERGLKLGHSAVSYDLKKVVSDVQEPNDNPLLLIDLASGRAETLCWPDSSVAKGHEAGAHVHPSFSPSGRWVYYSSDVTGVGQVYLVEAT